MTAWTSTDVLDQDAAPIILKAVLASAYQMPTPGHPDAQVNPDGATFAAVADLSGLSGRDVQAWVARHSGAGITVMACFARGAERGQISPDAYEAKVTLAEHARIREAARRELAAYLGPRGYRTDHLTASA